MTIRLTREKASGLKRACHALLTNPSPTIRELAGVVGKIVPSFPGVMYGPLHYRLLKDGKFLALQNTCWDFDKHISFTESQIRASLVDKKYLRAYNILKLEAPTITLTTNASKLGWGAVLATQSTGALWSSTGRQNHINYLELLAAFLGLQSFCSSKHDCHVRLMIECDVKC